MKIFFLLVALLALTAVPSLSQQIFEDASGESSLFINDKPFAFIRLNTSSSSATLGYNYQQPDGFDFGKFYLIGGLDFSATVKDNLGVVLKNSKLNPDVGLNPTLGIASDVLFKGETLFSLFYRGEFEHKNFGLIQNEADTSFIKGVTRWSNKHSVNLNLFTQYGSTLETMRFLTLGLSFGYRKNYNYDDLKEAELFYPITVNSNSVVYEKNTGRIGPLEPANSYPLRVDIGYLPNLFNQNSVGFNAYFNAETFTRQQVVNVGLGVFFTKENNPQSVIGGLSWQFTDVSNAKDADSSLVEKGIAFLYVGYILNK